MNGTKKLGVQLARFAVGVAVLLGVLFSIGQLLLDISNQKTKSKASITQIINTVSPLASKVAYELNTYSAEEVISGIIAYPTILSAEILGDQGQILARKQRVANHTVLSNFLNWTFVDLETFRLSLVHENYEQSVGQLNIQIDIATISDQVINRFFTNLLFGILRNVALAVALLFFFQKILTKPILALSKELGSLELSTIKHQVVKKPEHHEYDELGELVDSINNHLKSNFKTGQRLRQLQKMETIGHLTGGITHDFNNILGIVMCNLELIDRRVIQDRTTSSYVKEALNGVNRGTDIIKKLLNYSRVDAGEEKLVLVNEFIEGVRDLITKSMSVSINSEIHLAPNLWPVKINSGDLQDALLNLSLNARDAMPNGGSLLIETSNKTLDEDYVRLNPQIKVGDYVMISVSDTGIGMNLETLDRALEPFFTTKEEGKGTGLGLSMVYGFVRRSRGSVKIYSEIGEGTTIRIYLPRVQHAEGIEEDVQVKKLLPRGTETILVVDDEKALIKLATTNLEALGYKTLTSETGKHALRLLDEHKGIDLLFTDIIMPGGIDGYQLALAAHKMHPSLKILLTTGFTKKREEYINGEKKYLTELASNLVDKPYNQADLAQAVRKALDEGNKS